jgi:hypothetical protein
MQFLFVCDTQEYLEEYVGPNTRRTILYQVRNVKAINIDYPLHDNFIEN